MCWWTWLFEGCCLSGNVRQEKQCYMCAIESSVSLATEYQVTLCIVKAVVGSSLPKRLLWFLWTWRIYHSVPGVLLKCWRHQVKVKYYSTINILRCFFENALGLWWSDFARFGMYDALLRYDADRTLEASQVDPYRGSPPGTVMNVRSSVTVRTAISETQASGSHFD